MPVAPQLGAASFKSPERHARRRRGTPEPFIGPRFARTRWLIRALRPLLTRGCTNETVDDTGALINELLTAHPDIAAPDFLAHSFKPGRADAADADVVTEELVRGVRLDGLDGLRDEDFLGIAELVSLQFLRALLFRLAS